MAQQSIGIFLAPAPPGPGMIKSPPLDVANLYAVLDRDTDADIRLYDKRIRSICKEMPDEPGDINPGIFKCYKRCFDYALGKKDPLLNYVTSRILKGTDARNLSVIIFSISVLEQFSLVYLAPSLCLAKRLKENHPATRIVFFGNCPKMHARKIIKIFPFIDAILEDGNEFSLLAYLKRSVKGRAIEGVSYRHNGRLVHPSKKKSLSLNGYPVPAFYIFDLKKYKSHGKLVLPYEISRGCINNCFFCYYIHKGGIVRKDIQKVTKELNFLMKKYRVRLFHFMDAAINFDESYLDGLCEALIKRVPGIKWSALAIPNIKKNHLIKMKAAGCIQLRWGIEYASEKMLRTIGKGTRVSSIKKTLRDAHELGIYNYVTLLSGLPLENEKDKQDTRRFVEDMSSYIDAAKECVFGELGHFSIVQLESLLNIGHRRQTIPKEQYKDVLASQGIPSEDIVEVLAKHR